MSHAITQRKNGKSEMAYVGAKPWHGLGQELTEGQSIEQWLAAAGMDWKVQRSKVRYATGHGQDGAELATWDDYHVLMRSDTGLPLGMVSDRYKVVQPREVMEFFRDLVEVAGFKLITAGTLYGGKKFWAQADIKAEDRIVGNDLVKGRLLLATACDGSMRTIAKNCAERTVCANTLAIAMGEKGGPEIAISHKSTFDAESVKAQLGVSVDSFHRFITNARKLAERKVSKAEVSKVLSIVVDELDLEEAQNNRAFQSIMNLYDGQGRGAALPGVKGTAWGLLNAVTEFYDHHKNTRTDSARLNSAWFGTGNDKKEVALQKVMELVS